MVAFFGPAYCKHLFGRPFRIGPLPLFTPLSFYASRLFLLVSVCAAANYFCLTGSVWPSIHFPDVAHHISSRRSSDISVLPPKRSMTWVSVLSTLYIRSEAQRRKTCS